MEDAGLITEYESEACQRYFIHIDIGREQWQQQWQQQ